VGGCRGCDLRSACKTRLAPVSLDGLLPDDHRVRLVWSFVERLDLTALLATIKAVDGRPGHPPGGPRILMALASWRGSAAPARLRGSRRRQPQASRGASARCWRGRVPYCPARASFIGNIAHVGADVVDRHIGDGGALGVGDELDVIGRPETTVGHLHDPRLRIGRGGARLLGRWFPGFALRIRSRVLRRLPGRALGFLARRFLLFGVQFLGHCQRRPNPPLAILGRPPTRRPCLRLAAPGSVSSCVRRSCKSQPRQPPTHALRRRLLGQKIEQPFLFTRCPLRKENGAYALC
jgi:hypothetical protein